MPLHFIYCAECMWTQNLNWFKRIFEMSSNGFWNKRKMNENRNFPHLCFGPKVQPHSTPRVALDQALLPSPFPLFGLTQQGAPRHLDQVRLLAQLGALLPQAQDSSVACFLPGPTAARHPFFPSLLSCWQRGPLGSDPGFLLPSAKSDRDSPGGNQSWELWDFPCPYPTEHL